MRRPGSGHGLTERQRMIVEVIEDSVQRHGYGPTMREIGDAVELASVSSVSHQLSRLQEKGYLSRGPGRPRTAVVRPLAPAAAGDPPGHEVTEVPLVGRIAAGGPIYADQRSKTCFRCRVSSSATPCPGVLYHAEGASATR